MFQEASKHKPVRSAERAECGVAGWVERKAARSAGVAECKGAERIEMGWELKKRQSLQRA